MKRTLLYVLGYLALLVVAVALRGALLAIPEWAWKWIGAAIITALIIYAVRLETTVALYREGRVGREGRGARVGRARELPPEDSAG